MHDPNRPAQRSTDPIVDPIVEPIVEPINARTGLELDLHPMMHHTEDTRAPPTAQLSAVCTRHLRLPLIPHTLVHTRERDDASACRQCHVR